MATSTISQLVQQVTDLKAENKILRSKLPDRLVHSSQERRSLVRHDKNLGTRVKAFER